MIVATAATFLSEHYGAPVMLFALLLGIAMNFLAADGKCKAGIEFTARAVLRLGIALLGMRITLEQIATLGWKPVALVVIVVVATIAVSVVAAKVLGFKRIFGMLTGVPRLSAAPRRHWPWLPPCPTIRKRNARPCSL